MMILLVENDYKFIMCAVFTTSFAQLPTNCGKPTIQPSQQNGQTNFIVGGKSAVPYSWPWQVAIFRRVFTFTSLHCGGTLISSQWIMTAAHCVSDDQTLSKYTVKLGVYNQNSIDEDGEQVQSITKIIMNPGYNSQTQDSDVALLKVKRGLYNIQYRVVYK